MLGISLTDLLSNATAVWERQQGGESCFLGRGFTIVTHGDEKARLIDLLKMIQKTCWNLQADTKAILKLGCTISLIYQDDPTRKVLMAHYIKAIKNKKFSAAYARELQKSLSILHAIKQAYMESKEEALIGMRQALLHTIREEIGMVKVVAQKKKTSYFWVRMANPITKEGTSFLFSLLPTYWSLAFKNHSYATKLDMDEAYLEKALNSPHEEVRKIALFFLGHIETVKNNGHTNRQSDRVSHTLRAMIDHFFPFDEEVVQSLFPAFKTYFEHIKSYYLRFYVNKQQEEEVSEDYEQEEYQLRLEILEKVEREVKRVEGLYDFLLVEFERMRQESKSALGFMKEYGSSLFLTTEKVKKAIPTCDTYEALVPIEYSIEPEFFRRRKQVKDYVPERKEELPLEPLDKKDRKDVVATSEKRKERLSEPVEKEEELKATATLEGTEESWKKALGFGQSSPLDLMYPDHVIRWFERPDETVSADSRYNVLPSVVQKKVTIFHAFSLKVDSFVRSNYSIESTYANPRTGRSDKLYSVPAEIFWNGRIHRGYCQYAVDAKTGVCYHRCFSEKGDRFINTLLARQIWEERDYPSLAKSHAKSKSSRRVIMTEGGEIHFDPVFKSVHIKEVGYSMTLYRIGWS